MSVSHLTLRQLRAVAAIYATGRISTAAERLNVTQSAVSVLLGQAETALGARLFDRTTRSLTPTQTAEQVIGVIERVLGDLETIGAMVTDLRALERGSVRITATPATGMALLPETVRRFRAEYPRITLTLNDCAPNQFTAIIREQKVDFGLGMLPADLGEFDWRLMHDDPLYLVCSATSRWAGRATVRWQELDGVPLIVSRRDYGARSLVEDTMQTLDFRPNVVNEIGFLYSAVWMVACGMGVSIFPWGLARTIRDPEVATIPLVDPVVTRPIGVVTLRGRTLPPSSARFVEMLAQHLANDLPDPPGTRIRADMPQAVAAIRAPFAAG